MTLVAASIGTKYQIDCTNRILLLEDINEPPYRLDRLFQQMLQSGMLKGVVGFVLGDFTGGEVDNVLQDQFGTYTQEEFWGKFVGILHLGVPVLYNVAVGHIKNNLTVPLRMPMVLDIEAQQLRMPTSHEQLSI
mmetsp:Transcript_1029/g.1808  ORF Transcript_1029/g.1808 Transcript_1029/m.1808 type:complete len:134 (-) Transcript_1029:152-553(-)